MKQPTDELIDHVLHALRDSEPVSGLEGRILSRLEHTSEGKVRTSAFSVFLQTARMPFLWSPTQARYVFAGAALVLITTTSLLLSFTHRSAPTTAYTNRSEPVIAPRISAPAQAAPEAPRSVEVRSLRHTAPSSSPATLPDTPPDLESVALAETMAPSRLAPPLPLTAQEALLVRATRRGQPIELAELSHVRQTRLRMIADAREHSGLREYIQSLLAPLAAAQGLESTASPAPDPAPSNPSPEPSPSSSPN